MLRTNNKKIQQKKPGTKNMSTKTKNKRRPRKFKIIQSKNGFDSRNVNKSNDAKDGNKLVEHII